MSDRVEPPLDEQENAITSLKGASLEFSVTALGEQLTRVESANEAIERKSGNLLAFASGILLLLVRFGPEVVISVKCAAVRAILGWMVATSEILLGIVLFLLASVLQVRSFEFPKVLDLANDELLRRDERLLRYKVLRALVEVVPKNEKIVGEKATRFRWAIRAQVIVIFLLVAAGLALLAVGSEVKS